MKVVDMHAHIASYDLFHEFFLKGIVNGLKESLAGVMNYPGDSNLIDRLVKKKLNDGDCTRLLSEMDDAGIEKTVLLIADFGYGLDESDVPLNLLYERYHQVLSRHPGRFIVFGGTDPRRGQEALDLFERGITYYQFKGLKLYPPCGYELNDRRLYPYYELCKQHNIPVLTHTGPSLKSMKTERAYPFSIQEVARDFTEVNFVLGHAAFQNLKVNLKLAEENNNIFLETSGFQKILQNEEYLKQSIKKLMKKVPDQVVFGTDWPMFNMLNTQKKWVDFFRELNIMSEEQERLFFRENALRALRSCKSK
jgi:predicted TIM-barrel fold metal-dependent hydrolase